MRQRICFSRRLVIRYYNDRGSEACDRFGYPGPWCRDDPDQSAGDAECVICKTLAQFRKEIEEKE